MSRRLARIIVALMVLAYVAFLVLSGAWAEFLLGLGVAFAIAVACAGSAYVIAVAFGKRR